MDDIYRKMKLIGVKKKTPLCYWLKKDYQATIKQVCVRKKKHTNLATNWQKLVFPITNMQYHNMYLDHIPAILCREKLSIFRQGTFDSPKKVKNVSLEGDLCKQAEFPVSFGGLGCRRAGYIALPSFLASKGLGGRVDGNNSF